MAQLKELFLIGTDKLQCYGGTEDPNKTDSSSDMIALSVSNATTNEFYYDEDFAIPFDANLTDGQVAPLEDSLLLYSTSDGVSTSQCSVDERTERTLSPYRTVVDLSDSDVELDQSVRRMASSTSEGGSESYWGTDSRLLRGCGISVENDQLDMERSGEDLSSSSDSLARETDYEEPDVRLTTWAEVGMGSMKSLKKKPEVNYGGEIKASSSSEDSDQYERNRLVTWAELDSKVCHVPVVFEDELTWKRVRESVDNLETGFMQNSGSQVALATGFTSGDVSLVAKDTTFLNGSQSQVPLAAGMTTWRTLMTSGRHGESSSSSDDIRSTEEWPSYHEPESPTSPQREKSVSSPSSKDDGYDSVTKDLSINDSIQDSDEVQPQSEYHQFEGFASGGDSVESTMFSEIPEILRQALMESNLCSSISTTDDHQQAIPYHLLDNSLVVQQTVEDQQQSVETVDPLPQGRGMQDEESTRSTERWDSLNLSISASGQQSVVAPVSSFSETSTSRWPFDTGTKLSLTHESKGQQLHEAHTLPRVSKRMGNWSRPNVTKDSGASTSFVFRSLMRPLPDLGFLRKPTQSDRDDTQNLRICSETKTESVDAIKKQFILNSESSRLQQNTVERDSFVCSPGKEFLLETGKPGNTSRFCSTLSRTRSRNSDSAFSAHSSTSSGIDPGMVDLDDGYGTWNNRKWTLKAQNHLVEPWDVVAQQMPEAKRISGSCKEFDVKAGESRDIDWKTEPLVVKVCNTCNIRTVHLKEEKQTSQRCPPLFADCETRNLLTPPPKIIVSSIDNSNNKNAAFNYTDDLNENSRFENTALDRPTGNSSNSHKIGDITHESNSSKGNTDTVSIAFDTVKSSERSRCDNRKPCSRDVERRLVSEDRIQTNSRFNAADHSGTEALVNYEKSRSVIDGKDRRKQLTNSSTREQELNEQCTKAINPTTVCIGFSQKKDNGVKRMERQVEREKEIQMPRANKNVSILENGVRFRPGSTKGETASQCTVSKAIRVASVDQEKLQKDVIAGVWKSVTSSDDEARSPVDDQPPVDFLISSDIDSSLEFKPSMDTCTKKADLLLNVMKSVETLLHHFNRNRTLKGQSGNTQSDGQVGHLVLDHLCPAVQAILLDGLKPELQGLFGTVRNSVRQVIEDSATLGHPPNLVRDLVTSLKRLKFLNTPWLFFNAFIFALLNCKALDFWLSYVHSHASLLEKHYTPLSFLRLSHSTAHHRAFQDLTAFLQPLALVPFRLEYNFEVKILEGRLEEHRARLALERHLVATDACLGLVEVQQNFSNDRLLEYSGNSAEETSYLGNTESELLNKPQQYSSMEASNEVRSNRRPLCALKTQGEDNNEARSGKRPPATPRSSQEVVGARVISRVEPHAIAINQGVEYTPVYRNYQRNSELLSPLCPDKLINYTKQDNQVPRRADSSVVFTQHSNAATRTLWSDYRQRLGLLTNRLEKLVFGSS